MIALRLMPVVALAACAAGGTLVDVPGGTVMVVEDAGLARFSPVTVDGIEVEPFPEFGGRRVVNPDGSPLIPADEGRAIEALEAHCGGPVRDVSFRGYGEAGLSTWSSAPCG